MKSRRPKFFSVMAWIVTLALSLSTVMGQTAQIEDRTANEAAIPSVDTSVLPELPLSATAAAFPAGAKSSTMPAPAPAPPKPAPNVDAPGQSKWVILAALIITGAVVGTILLLRGLGGGDDKPHPPSPTGTIITAGTPTVSAPSH